MTRPICLLGGPGRLCPPVAAGPGRVGGTVEGVPATRRSPAADPTVARPAPAERLLDAATDLFSSEGVRAVGIDRILRTADVARASLYSAYGSKDGLVTAYLDRLDYADRDKFAAFIEPLGDPAEKVLALFDLAAGSAPGTGFRGCRYLNAVTEFPDERTTLLAPVIAHREWLLDTLTELLTAAGVDDPAAMAADVRLIYDGALAGAKFAADAAPILRGRALVAAMLGR